MVSETKITGGNHNNGLSAANRQAPVDYRNQPVDLAADLSGVAHDITQLAELQGQLFVVDVKEAQAKLKLPVYLAGAGGLIALCAMPLLQVAIAQGLILAGLQPWASYALVSGAGLLCGGLLLWQSWRLTKDSALVLERSKAELSLNIQWLKQMLKQRAEGCSREASHRS